MFPMIEDAAALQPEDLMCGKGRHIDCGERKRHLPQSLYHVAVHHGTGMRMHIRRDLLDRIDAAGLIVDQHDRYEDGILAQRLFHILQMHPSICMQR